MGKAILLSALSLLALAAVAQPDSQEATTAFAQDMLRLGNDEVLMDWSDEKKVNIPEPACAYINITGIEAMPTSKTANLHAWMEAYTGGGNYFRKRIIISAQGNSSLAFDKKNFKVDFCEDEWLGDKTTSITIGDWVKQDSYHFKAYYIDYLRGVGAVGYELYDQMAATVGHPWTRAAGDIPKPKENARCYPGGFPCVVYLNGGFYGVYAWQLKKHRDNMNQTKSTAEHIHLDGKLNEETLWGNRVDWTAFEVRNPKGLYTMAGETYDGDKPKELIDETSTRYLTDGLDESVAAGHSRTAQVKHYITAIGAVIDTLRTLEAKRDTAAIKDYLGQHFDMQSLVDYACFHQAVDNWDGFAKNWQWFTYDGKKWFVTPYDLDCIMGNFFTGNFIIPADWNFVYSSVAGFDLMGPFRTLRLFCQQDLKQRYTDLREQGVIAPDNIISMLHWWYFGVDSYYASEWSKWSKSRCISETVVNPGWKKPGDWKKFATLPTYSDTVAYAPGDRCRLDYLVWEATDDVKGVKPYAQLGYRDSLARYEQWVELRIALLDAHYDYKPAAERGSVTLNIPATGWATVCVPFEPQTDRGLQFYTLKGLSPDGTGLQVEQEHLPQAHKPYLVKGTPGRYRLTGVKESLTPGDDGALENHLLRGTYRALSAPAQSYLLRDWHGEATFAQTDSAAQVPAYTAYAVVPGGGKLLLPITDDIVVVTVNPQEATTAGHYGVFDQAGRRHSTLQKGLNILRYSDGRVKKVLVK